MKTTTKGKFKFPKSGGATTATPDSVTFSGTIELPEGLDISKDATQPFAFGIGNVFDTVTLNSKGTATGKSTKAIIKTIKVTYPKLKKGETKTAAGTFAKFTVTMSEVGMSADGFDTEGVTGTLRTDETGKKSVARSIQVAMVLAGVVFQQSADVSF